MNRSIIGLFLFLLSACAEQATPTVNDREELGIAMWDACNAHGEMELLGVSAAGEPIVREKALGFPSGAYRRCIGRQRYEQVAALKRPAADLFERVRLTAATPPYRPAVFYDPDSPPVRHVFASTEEVYLFILTNALPRQTDLEIEWRSPDGHRLVVERAIGPTSSSHVGNWVIVRCPVNAPLRVGSWGVTVRAMSQHVWQDGFTVK